MNALRRLIALLLLVLSSGSSFAITDAQVFAFAEANYPSLFAGTASTGQYLQYNYRHYQLSGNYLAVDTSGAISVFGTATGNVLTTIGPVATFAGYITAWEAMQAATANIAMGGAIQGRDLAMTTGVVTTFAGGGGGASFCGYHVPLTCGARDGMGTAASFFSPSGITTDGTNLYVADLSNRKIRKIVIATGAVTTLAGGGSTNNCTSDCFVLDGVGTAATFDSPNDITTDGISLYVAEPHTRRIRKVMIATGTVTTLAGSGSFGAADGIGAAASFSSPVGITTDGANLYVTEDQNHIIRKIVIATGAVTTLAGSAGISGSSDGIGTAASFNFPGGITTDGTNLYVLDAGTRIRKIVIATGTVTTLAGSGLNGAVDGIGTAASFSASSGGITTDGANLYVGDFDNNIIRKIVIATGAVSTLAGGGGGNTITFYSDCNNCGAKDGVGMAASFHRPSGITTDGANLYVADIANQTIRKIAVRGSASIGAVPAITGISPSTGAAGTSATITGAGFDVIAANNRVTFNGVPATVTAATTTSLTVTVPAGTTSGAVSVATPYGTAASTGNFTVPPTAPGGTAASVAPTLQTATAGITFQPNDLYVFPQDAMAGFGGYLNPAINIVQAGQSFSIPQPSNCAYRAIIAKQGAPATPSDGLTTWDVNSTVGWVMSQPALTGSTLTGPMIRIHSYGTTVASISSTTLNATGSFNIHSVIPALMPGNITVTENTLSAATILLSASSTSAIGMDLLPWTFRSTNTNVVRMINPVALGNCGEVTFISGASGRAKIFADAKGPGGATVTIGPVNVCVDNATRTFCTPAPTPTPSSTTGTGSTAGTGSTTGTGTGAGVCSTPGTFSGTFTTLNTGLIPAGGGLTVNLPDSGTFSGTYSGPLCEVTSLTVNSTLPGMSGTYTPPIAGGVTLKGGALFSPTFSLPGGNGGYWQCEGMQGGRILFYDTPPGYGGLGGGGSCTITIN